MAIVPTLEILLERLVDAVQAAGVFVGILLVAYLPGRFMLIPFLKWAQTYVPVSDTVWNPFVKVTNAALAVFALYLAVPLSGLATTPTTIAALTAAATLAIGFASRDVLSNLVSGSFIVLDPTFHIGDWIIWQDKQGIIEDISFRVTRVHTFDNELITVPNSELTANAVTSPSAKDVLRISQELPISYEDSIANAESAILDVAAHHDEVLDRPRASVRVDRLGGSAIVLVARFWIGQPRRADTLRIRSEFIQRVTERFDREGIIMPYPTRELRGSIETRPQPPGDDEITVDG